MSQTVYIVNEKDDYNRIVFSKVFDNLDAARKCLIYKVEEFNIGIRFPLKKQSDNEYSTYDAKIYIDCETVFTRFEEPEEHKRIKK